jgi:HK97 gp10 family phage protein
VAITTPEGMAFEFGAQAAQAGIRAGTAVIAAAALIQREAKQNSPFKTGFLRNSITRETRRHAHGAEAEVGPEAFYGAFLENGTEFMDPRPYLMPAALTVEPQFEQALGDIVGFDAHGTAGISTTILGQMTGRQVMEQTDLRSGGRGITGSAL